MSYALPDWFRFLRTVAISNLTSPVGPRSRITIAAPGARLALGCAVFSAVRQLAVVRAETPLNLPNPEAFPAPVSHFGSGKYEDATLRAITDGVPSLQTTTGPVQLQQYADIVRVLPDEFPHRTAPRRIPDLTSNAWQTVDRFGVNANRIHARVSATPILVIGSRNSLAEGFEDLRDVVPSPAEFCDVGSSFDEWYRHPVIAVGTQHDAAEPWLADLQPALVVTLGAAAWTSKLRRAFWDVPHLLILDRQSPAGIDLVESLALSRTTLARTTFAVPHGFEAMQFTDHALALGGAGYNEEFE